MAEITGQDAGCAEFSSAMAWVIGDARYRLTLTLASYNQRLRDDLHEPDHLAAEADATEIVGTMRTLQAIMGALSLKRAAEVLLLAEDLYGRIAAGEIDPPEMLLAAADAIFWRLADHAKIGSNEDIPAGEAADFDARMRSSVALVVQQTPSDEGQSLAGLIPGPSGWRCSPATSWRNSRPGIGRGEVRTKS